MKNTQPNPRSTGFQSSFEQINPLQELALRSKAALACGQFDLKNPLGEAFLAELFSPIFQRRVMGLFFSHGFTEMDAMNAVDALAFKSAKLLENWNHRENQFEKYFFGCLIQDFDFGIQKLRKVRAEGTRVVPYLESEGGEIITKSFEGSEWHADPAERYCDALEKSNNLSEYLKFFSIQEWAIEDSEDAIQKSRSGFLATQEILEKTYTSLLKEFFDHIIEGFFPFTKPKNGKLRISKNLRAALLRTIHAAPTMREKILRVWIQRLEHHLEFVRTAFETTDLSTFAPKET